MVVVQMDWDERSHEEAVRLYMKEGVEARCLLRQLFGGPVFEFIWEVEADIAVVAL